MPIKNSLKVFDTWGIFLGIKKAFSYEKALMLVIPKGFEPLTHRLEICCSIQLSYETMLKKKAATVEDKS
jgi:hypothetical protein